MKKCLRILSVILCLSVNFFWINKTYSQITKEKVFTLNKSLNGLYEDEPKSYLALCSALRKNAFILKLHKSSVNPKSTSDELLFDDLLEDKIKETLSFKIESVYAENIKPGYSIQTLIHTDNIEQYTNWINDMNNTVGFKMSIINLFSQKYESKVLDGVQYIVIVEINHKNSETKIERTLEKIENKYTFNLTRKLILSN